MIGNTNAVNIVRFHLHPDVFAVIEANTVVTDQVKFTFSGSYSINLVPYEYAPEFNKTIPSICIEVEFYKRVVTSLIMLDY